MGCSGGGAPAGGVPGLDLLGRTVARVGGRRSKAGFAARALRGWGRSERERYLAWSLDQYAAAGVPEDRLLLGLWTTPYASQTLIFYATAPADTYWQWWQVVGPATQGMRSVVGRMSNLNMAALMPAHESWSAADPSQIVMPSPVAIGSDDTWPPDNDAVLSWCADLWDPAPGAAANRQHETTGATLAGGTVELLHGRYLHSWSQEPRQVADLSTL
jgi:hypothetical protein